MNTLTQAAKVVSEKLSLPLKMCEQEAWQVYAAYEGWDGESVSEEFVASILEKRIKRLGMDQQSGSYGLKARQANEDYISKKTNTVVK